MGKIIKESIDVLDESHAMTLTTNEQRREHVVRMRASFALEGLLPDLQDLIVQQHYIDGAMSLVDLHAYAIAFAVRNSPSSGRVKQR